MKTIKRLAVAFCVLLAVLAAVPFLFSLDDYRPRIEAAVSERIKEPVSIDRLRLVMLPLPYLAVDGVAIGERRDLTIGNIKVIPDLYSLVYPIKVIKAIDVDGVDITKSALDRISAWSGARPSAGSGAPPSIRVEAIRLSNATLRLDKITLGPLNIRVRLDKDGRPEHAALETLDGKVRAALKPEGKHYLVDASARAWKLPVGPAIVFDELTIKGVATARQLNLGMIHARLYGGSLAGRADIAWHKGIQVKGQANVNQVELRTLAPLFSPNARVSGRLVARPVAFSTTAPKAAQLKSQLRIEAPFQVHDGIVHGVDVQKAATSLSKDEAGGGETRFQELSGNLLLDRGTYRFTGLKIASGSLAASGHVTISPEQELSGRINAEVKAAKIASVPLNVSGTTQSPMLFPTAGYLAGAAAGTAVLGPVLGTTVGAKIGSWAESLFSSEQEKPSEPR